MARLTISDAARRGGVDRRTLQRAIRTGRLVLTPDHQLTVEALQQAGYHPTASPPRRAASQRRSSAAAAPHGAPQASMPQDLSQSISCQFQRQSREAAG